MVEYDAAVIHKFADYLYRRANSIILAYTVTGALVGLVLGFLLSSPYGRVSSAPPWAAILGVVLLGGLGYFLGRQRAFMLKLQAQQALCQVKIEENTQRSVSR